MCFCIETVNHLLPKVTVWLPCPSWFWTQHCVFILELLQSVDFANKWWTSKALELGLHSAAESENPKLWSQHNCKGKLTSLLRRFWSIGLRPSGIASGKKHREGISKPLKWPSRGERTKIGEVSGKRGGCALHYYLPRWDSTDQWSPLWMWTLKLILGPKWAPFQRALLANAHVVLC